MDVELVPVTADRLSTPRPEAKPSTAPTVDEARALAQTFDDKPFEGDVKGAYEMLSCVNLYEKSMWGGCSPSDLLAVSPSTHGDERMESPWMSTRSTLDVLTKVVADNEDPVPVPCVDAASQEQKYPFILDSMGGWRVQTFGAVSIMGAG